jgi:transposase
MILNRQKVPDGSASAKALDYSLRRWGPLTRFLSDGQLPVDNNWIHADIGMSCVMPTPGLCRFKVKNLDSNSRSTVCVSA